MTEAFISIGSNVEREHNLRAADRALRALGRVRHSTVYESEAVGFEGDPFYNLVTALETDLPVERLAAELARIEAEHGRERHGARFAPRTLDLDLMLFGDVVSDRPKLLLPRPEITRYAFMLRPLAELAGALRHPLLGESYATLWERFDDPGQRLWPVAFDW